LLTCRDRGPFRVVRVDGPAGTDILSEHPTPADAFRELDSVLSAAQRNVPPGDTPDLLVVDTDGVVVPRSAIG
jgi:hypothetical protein